MPTQGAAGHLWAPRWTGDPLYASRRTLHTGTDLLTDKQKTRLSDLFTAEQHAAVTVTWQVYQRLIAA